LESPGSTNRLAEPQTSEGNLRTGVALETDADQARDDERDNFSLNDEENGEKYDKFGEDEEASLNQNEDDPIVRDDLKKSDREDFNSFGKTNQRQTESDVANSDDEEHHRRILAA
jgi:hypothetical protein